MVLRLIGWYQNGQQQPTTELAFKPGPLPKFDGITLPGASTSPTGAVFPQGALQPQLSGQNTVQAPIRVPPLDPAKVQQYSGLFGHSGAQNGLLDGATAKSIFERAGLPNDVLGKIWMLSDREQRGALDETEFIVAMHLLTCMKTRKMAALPNSLPPGLYEAAARRGQRPPSRQASMQAGAPARQLTGSGVGAVPRTQSPLARPPSSTYSTPQMQSAQPTGAQWLITPQDKAQFDRHFSTVDTSGRGVLSGEQAVQFFSDSRLPEDTLASIWDLADINSEGQLNRDEFAVAMYLIRQQRAPNPPPVPAFLPAALVPPSMRGPQQVQQPPAPFQQPTAFDTTTQTPVQPKSASDDLFGLDSSPSQAQTTQPQPSLQPQGTGASATRDPFAGSQQGSPGTPPRFQAQQPGSATFKPFIPTSAFGASLASQHTGSSTTSSQAQQPRGPKAPMPSAMDDLLGDSEANAEESRQITNESTELANMSNQIGNLRTQMEATQNKKSATQADINATNSQKTDLEQRLQQFRAQYETEVRTVKEMEQQLATSRASTKKLGQDLAMLEGTHQDLQTQHNSVSQQLQADQQENANLKQRISQINAEVTRLKAEMEKMKLDARQQKGLVSINKKQLATNEAERDRMESEKADLEREAAEEQTRSLASSPEPAIVSQTSNVASPAASTMSSTNPFFRMTSQEGGSSSLPAAAGPNPSAFDAIFGPSTAFAPTGQAGSRSGTPPATSFIGRSMPSAGTAAAVGVGAAAVGAAAVGGVVAADSLSSAGEGTPSATPPLSDRTKESPLTSEPPPPPESRQFTPTHLPIGGGVVGANGPESDTASSTRVVPPASRAGGFETPREMASRPPSVFDSGGSVPSAFSPEQAKPEESEREIVPGTSPAEERQPSIVAQEVVPSNGPSTEDVTPAPQTKPADDFESAFASFGEGEKAKEAGAGEDPFAPSSSRQGEVVDNEFPPIQNLEREDESDSDDEPERGFDDDFTTASPPRNGVPAAANVVEAAAPTNPSDLPDIAKETSPPTYEQSEGPAAAAAATERTSSNNFPQEFGSLLPAREDPTSPPPPPSDEPVAGPPDEAAPVPLPSETQSLSQTVESSSDTFVDASSRPLSSIPDSTPITQTAPAPTSAAPKNFFDEFDDFGDLSEAREADKTGNDLDFAFGRQSQDEFNPVFDSPAPSQTPTPMKAVSVPASSQESNGFANFIPNTSTIGTGPLGGGTGSVQRTSQDVQHDWDAIFSGLDNSRNIDTSFGNSNSDEIWQPPPGPPPGREPITTNGSSAPIAAPVAQSASTAKANTAIAGAFGRAITPGTEHDDPILKRLTSMGYPRTDALKALEMYDYDINKVSHFTSKKCRRERSANRDDDRPLTTLPEARL